MGYIGFLPDPHGGGETTPTCNSIPQALKNLTPPFAEPLQASEFFSLVLFTTLNTTNKAIAGAEGEKGDGNQLLQF